MSLFHPIVFKEKVIKNNPLNRITKNKIVFEGLYKFGMYLPKVSATLKINKIVFMVIPVSSELYILYQNSYNIDFGFKANAGKTAKVKK